MILKNKINLIWYGRGNLTQESECDAFDLQSTDGELATRPSALIEVVYKVSATDDGSSGWKEWSSVDYLNGDTIDAEFTKLECGHLYIVIMQGSGDGIKQIDIPEAITASDNPTTTINDEALIISPDNVVENDDDDDDDDDVVVECLPNADDDTWKIFVPSTGDEATAMLNSSSNEIFTYSGMFAGFTMNWKFAMSKSVSLETTDAGDANISFTMNLGADTEVLTIDGKEVAEDTKFRMEIVSMTAKDGQENVVGSDASNPVGCWEGTSVNNVINLTRVEGFEVVDDETTEDNTNTGNTGNTDETENDPDIWADETGCLGFIDDDAEGLYRVRFKYDEQTVIVTPETDFQITQKTADGEKLVTDATIKEKLETGIQGAIDAVDDEEESAFKSSVDYSFVFTYAESGNTSNPAVQIVYPQEADEYKVSFNTTFNAVEISVKRVMIYDPERTEQCATFTEPMSDNLFVGAGMV